MVTNIIDILANFVVATIHLLGYPGIVFLMTVEACGIPMPSEVIMPFSGFLVYSGTFNFYLVVAAGVLGDLLGASIAYFIGNRGGRPLFEKYGKYVLLSRHDLDSADRWFKKYGEAATFFGRVLPIVRTYISFPAGIAKMKYSKFILFTFLGALPWILTLTYLGTKMGANWSLIREKMHSFDLAIGIIIVILLILYIWRHIKHSRR